MKHFLLISLSVICFLISAKAQQNSENICLETKKLNNRIADDNICLFGEVFKPQEIKWEKDETTLSKVIALSGGFTKKAVIQKIQNIKCSSDFSSVENSFFINFSEIKKGNLIDPVLGGGEIIYVPKGGKLKLDRALPIPIFVSEPKNQF